MWYVVGIGGSFWTPSEAAHSAQQAASDGCMDGDTWVEATIVPAAPRAVTVHIRVPGSPGQFGDSNLQSNLRSYWMKNMIADPEVPGRFVTHLGATDLNAVAQGAEWLGCEPQAPDLECGPQRMAIKQTGVFPDLVEAKVDWTGAPAPPGTKSAR